MPSRRVRPLGDGAGELLRRHAVDCPEFMNQCSAGGVSPSTTANASVFAPTAAPPPRSSRLPSADAGAATPSATAQDDAASAMPSCQDAANGALPGGGHLPLGSSNFPPLLSKLAPLVLAAGYTPVYAVTSSCTGVSSVFGASHTISDPAPAPGAKYAAYFQADGTSVPCLLGSAGAQVDIGESDIFSTTCNAADVAGGGGAGGGGVGEYLGPIQGMVFIVPGKSRERAITAEAARAVFGMGGAGAPPWTNPSLYFVRNASTGTQQMIAHAIGVPATAFWGVDRGSAASVDALVRVISDESLAEQAIGIISADYYDDDRANVKALAFKATDQDCAYLPDSNEFKKDKENVRDGHYPIWGPIHFFAAIANGVPVTTGAQAFVSVVSVPNIQKSLVDAFIASSLVPGCAMSVQRTSELGPLSTYAPPFGCGCYFEASPEVNGAAPAGCAACATAADCPASRPACNLGYCEVQ